MINITSIKNINNLSDYEIIIPSNYDLYYKELFVNENITFNTVRNFLINNYDGSKKLINDTQKYILMKQAFNSVKKSLLVYKDVTSSRFITDLINTYDDFKSYTLIKNDKTNDLSKIYGEYEKIILSNNLINEKLLLDEVMKNNHFTSKYLFLSVQLPSLDTIKLINKMKDEGCVLLDCDIINNNYLKCKLGFDKKDVSLDKETYFKALNDIYDEVSFVNNLISKNIYEGLSYDDILIVCDKDTYIPYFDLLLNHPFNNSKKTGVLTSRFIKILCDILSGCFSSDNFINLLKLGLFNISDKKIDSLDNYVYSWNLEDKNFYEEFTYNPTGNKKNFSSFDIKKLDSLNKIKDDVISPIRTLLENVINESDKTQILRYFYMYLDCEGIMEKLFEKDSEGALKLVNVFNDMNNYLNSNASFSEIMDVLKNISFESDKTEVYQDTITISNLEDFVLEGKKIVYFLGATNEFLPKEFKPSHLISSYDIDKDNLNELILDNKNKWDYLFSHLILFKNVYVTTPKLGNDLKLKEASVMLNKVIKKDIEIAKIYDRKSMIKDYAIKLSNNKINKVCDDYFCKINEVNHHNLNLRIPSNTALKLYSKTLNVSPSSIETYAKCPFYHFILYGLKLKVKEKYLFDSREVGTFVHYLLENVIKNDIDNIKEENTYEIIKKYSLSYLKDNGKIIDNKTKYLIEELSKSTSNVINMIVSEQEKSRFKPTFFELKIDDNSTVTPLSVKLLNGTLNINGIVDRVDTYQDDENFYYRIIDYKTGEKKFRLDEVLMGLNLQMLIYLLAIKNSHSFTDKKMIPSALLYYPALLKESKSSRGLTLEEKEKSVYDRLKMNGIINSSGDVLDLFGEDLKCYTDSFVRDKLSFEKVFSMDDINNVFEYMINTIKTIGNNILDGKISVSPVEDGCKYCKFSSICKFDKKIDKTRKIKSYKNTEVYQMLEGDNNA
ncbi:putative helicase-exonuclease AddAB AddB subunit [Clostridium sp. CAG:594]|nr:putative helicase-exonuclease AddAB AddB subunit [Clostridium sp. CAG:594]